MSGVIKVPRHVMWPISKLKPNPRNVKLHPRHQILGLCEIVKKDGFLYPISPDEKGVIWKGHARYECALELGMVRVPILKDMYDRTEDEKYEAMLYDNKINESAWNMPNVKMILEERPKIDLSKYHITLEPKKFNLLDDDIEKGVPDKVPKRDKLGDLWKLGSHRVIVGDCTVHSLVQTLLKDREIDQIVTDPPYGVDYSSKNRFLDQINKGGRITKEIKGDKDIDYQEFFIGFLQDLPMADYNTIYIFMSGQRIHELRIAVELAGYKWGDYLIWLKNAPVFGRKDYMAKHEFILYGWKGRHKFYGEASSTCIEYKRPHTSELHPTMKPVGLLEKLLQDGSIEGMSIYDPFLGSGSTLLACERKDRVCYGMEIDPRYADVTIYRWELLTGMKAEKVAGK